MKKAVDLVTIKGRGGQPHRDRRLHPLSSTGTSGNRTGALHEQRRVPASRPAAAAARRPMVAGARSRRQPKARVHELPRRGGRARTASNTAPTQTGGYSDDGSSTSSPRRRSRTASGMRTMKTEQWEKIHRMKVDGEGEAGLVVLRSFHAGDQGVLDFQRRHLQSRQQGGSLGGRRLDLGQRARRSDRLGRQQGRDKTQFNERMMIGQTSIVATLAVASPSPQAAVTATTQLPPPTATAANAPDRIPDDLACTRSLRGLQREDDRPTARAPLRARSPRSGATASKGSYLQLPEGQTIDTSAPDDWKFPVGTKVWKDIHKGPKRSRPATSTKLPDQTWIAGAYVWSEDGAGRSPAPVRTSRSTTSRITSPPRRSAAEVPQGVAGPHARARGDLAQSARRDRTHARGARAREQAHASAVAHHRRREGGRSVSCVNCGITCQHELGLDRLLPRISTCGSGFDGIATKPIIGWDIYKNTVGADTRPRREEAHRRRQTGGERARLRHESPRRGRCRPSRPGSSTRRASTRSRPGSRASTDSLERRGPCSAHGPRKNRLVDAALLAAMPLGLLLVGAFSPVSVSPGAFRSSHRRHRRRRRFGVARENSRAKPVEARYRKYRQRVRVDGQLLPREPSPKAGITARILTFGDSPL